MANNLVMATGAMSAGDGAAVETVNARRRGPRFRPTVSLELDSMRNDG